MAEKKSGYFFLVRHGLYDTVNGSLNRFGRKDVAELGASMVVFMKDRADFELDKCVLVTGMLARHRETTQILNGLFRLPVIFMAELAYGGSIDPVPQDQLANTILPLVESYNHVIAVASAAHTSSFSELHVLGKYVGAADYASVNVVDPQGMHWLIAKDTVVQL